MQNKLPEETINQIKSDSIKYYPCTVVLNEHMDNVERYRLGYIAGATEWAQWKVAYDELKREADDLQRWKREAYLVIDPIIEYGQGHPDAKLGHSIVAFVIDRCKDYDRLKERCENLETALKQFISYHETGLLPDSFTYLKGVKALAHKPEGINEKEGEKLLNPEEDTTPHGMPLPAEDPFKNI